MKIHKILKVLPDNLFMAKCGEITQLVVSHIDSREYCKECYTKMELMCLTDSNGENV